MATEIIEPQQKIFLPFGITRLDQDLEGIPAQDFCLVCGGTHTGKSVFAFNFLLDGLKKEETVAMVSSIPPEEVLDQSDVLQLPIRDYVEAGELILLYQKTQHPHLIHDKEDLIAVTSALEEELLPWEPSRLVFDSFVPFMSLFHPDYRENGLRASFRRLRQLGLTVMLTTRMPRSSDALNMRAFVEGRSSCYFYLDEHRPPNGNPIRRLVVRKMQGMQPPYPVYNFVIEKGSGVNVYERTDTPLEKPQEGSATDAAQRKEKEPSKIPSHKTPLDFRDNMVLKERLEEDEAGETTAEEGTPGEQNNILFFAEKENLNSDESTEDTSAFPPFSTEESQPPPQKNDFSFLDLGYDALAEEEKEIETDNAEPEPETQPDKADSLGIKREKISFSDYSKDLVAEAEIQEPESDVIETADVESEPTSDVDESSVALTTDTYEFEVTPPTGTPTSDIPPAITETVEYLRCQGVEFEEKDVDIDHKAAIEGEDRPGHIGKRVVSFRSPELDFDEEEADIGLPDYETANAEDIDRTISFSKTDISLETDVDEEGWDYEISAWPTAADITYGQTLNESKLSGGEALDLEGEPLAGSFAWTEVFIAPEAGAEQSFGVTFTPDDHNYDTVAGDVMIDVAKASPKIIAWPTAADISYGRMLKNVELTGGVALGVDDKFLPGLFAWTNPSFEPEAGAEQTFSVTFTPENNNYSTVAGDVVIHVAKATPDVTEWPTATDISYGQTLEDAELTGGAAVGVEGEPLPGSFAWTNTFIAPQAGAQQAFSVTFTPENDNYSTAAGDVVIHVTKATPDVTEWPTATDISYGQTLEDAELTGGAAVGIDGKFLLGSFAWTDASITPHAGAGQSFSVTFTPDNDNYSTVAGDLQIDVAKATPLVEWPEASGLTYGETLGEAELTGGVALGLDRESLTGSFAWTDASITPQAGAEQSFSVTFTPDNDNYSTVTGDVKIDVAKAIPNMIAWPTATEISYGEMLAESELTGGMAQDIDGEPLAGTFDWTDDSIVPQAGAEQTFSVTFTPDNDNYSTAAGNVKIDVVKAIEKRTYRMKKESELGNTSLVENIRFHRFPHSPPQTSETLKDERKTKEHTKSKRKKRTYKMRKESELGNTSLVQYIRFHSAHHSPPQPSGSLLERLFWK